MPTVTTHVTDEWFVDAPEAELFGATVHLVPPTQFIWSKIFVQDHHRFDMADVAHMILKCHDASIGGSCSATWSSIGRCC